MVMLAWPMMYCNALGFIGFLQRAWHPAVRSGPGKAAKNSRPVPPSEEIGISGQLRPQYCGGCFRDGQDRLRPGPRHGTPAGNCYLCDWRCPAALEPFQVAEGLSRSALSLISALLFAEVAEQTLSKKMDHTLCKSCNFTENNSLFGTKQPSLLYRICLLYCSS